MRKEKVKERKGERNGWEKDINERESLYNSFIIAMYGRVQFQKPYVNQPHMYTTYTCKEYTLG